MSFGAHPLIDRPDDAERSPDGAAAGPPLRLPEDRAFDVATINGRLARMAARAAPRSAGPKPGS